MWYSGYEQINIQPSQIFTAAQYPIWQAAVADTFSGVEELMIDDTPQCIFRIQTSVAFDG
jgi:hypothetical protein